jgi:hypothetical protein
MSGNRRFRGLTLSALSVGLLTLFPSARVAADGCGSDPCTYNSGSGSSIEGYCATGKDNCQCCFDTSGGGKTCQKQVACDSAIEGE